MQVSIASFFLFEGKAEEALTFYVATVPNSSIMDIQRYGDSGPGTPGSVIKATASIGGLTVKFSESFVKYAFSFTPSTSLFVTCISEVELDRLVDELGSGEEQLIPPGNYGFSQTPACVSDRFGVS